MGRIDGKVAVALSGGIDSSLAAILLRERHEDIVGMTFRMRPDNSPGPARPGMPGDLESVTRARLLCEQLGIGYRVCDLGDAFTRDVIDYFCACYVRGRTPNPCVVCNERIKFGALLDRAKALGAAFLATGHYARVRRDRRSGRFLLVAAKDRAKDQSYFLCRLTQEQLRHALFPLGGLTYAAVRSLARARRLRLTDSRPSQDVCFVRDRHYADFIRDRADGNDPPGDIVDTRGTVLGRHRGITRYTVGQRRGLAIAHCEPLYVVGIDAARRRVIVGPRKDMYRKSLTAEDLNWIAIESLDKPRRVTAKIRYNAERARAVVTPAGRGLVRVEFDHPQFAPTPGQAVVFYDRDTVLGGGWITRDRICAKRISGASHREIL